MSIHHSSGFVIRNSQINYVGGNQITIHRHGLITNEVSNTGMESIIDDIHAIPRLSQVEVPLLDDSPGITVYGRDTLFQARLRPVFGGGWTPGGSGEDETRVVVRRLAKETTDEDFHQEIKYALTYYHSFVMQLFGVSRTLSPNKFLVYSNPNISTYVDYKESKRLRGEDYRTYDSQYDSTFNDAWKYLKTEVPVDGFTLDIIFSGTRTVNSKQGSALIVVPALPSSPVDRTKLIIKVLEEFQSKIRRRIEVSKMTRFTRCPECLPSTGGWNAGLINSVLRCLVNAQPHLEWGQLFIQNEQQQQQLQPSDSDGLHAQGPENERNSEFINTFGRANELINDLKENAQRSLDTAMNDVILRSHSVDSGICSWCGKNWVRQEEPLTSTSSIITIVDDMVDASVKEKSSDTGNKATLVQWRMANHGRIFMLVACILLAGLLALLSSMFW